MVKKTIKKVRYIKKLFILLSIFFSSGCSVNNDASDDDEIQTEKIRYINEPSSSIVTLKKKILFEGDEKAYMELYNFLVTDQMNPDAFLFWAYIWAYKYDKTEGYYDIFECLSSSCNFEKIRGENSASPCLKELNGIEYVSLDHLEDITRSIALESLEIAAKRGMEQAEDDLKKYEMLDSVASN